MASVSLRRLAAVAGATLAFAGCASDASSQLSRREASSSSASGGDAGDEVHVGVLAPRELAGGQCGLFLWTRAAAPELVFFANPESGEAAIMLDGRERALGRLSVEAPVEGGRAGSQTFATQSGDVSVRLTVQETETVQDGYRVGSASLRISDAAGWSGVVPTAGLAACRP